MTKYKQKIMTEKKQNTENEFLTCIHKFNTPLWTPRKKMSISDQVYSTWIIKKNILSGNAVR